VLYCGHGTTTEKRVAAARAIIVWLLLIAAEILHGIARAVLLVPAPATFGPGRSASAPAR